MPEIHSLYTGEVRVVKGRCVLMTKAIASCVAVVVFEGILKIGGMAHIMLPGRAPESYSYKKTRFAENGIEELIENMKVSGGNEEAFKACIVGGGNVLKHSNDLIGATNVQSVKNTLKSLGIPILAEDTGGVERRGLQLQVWSGNLYQSVGDEKFKLLCNFKVYENNKQLLI